MKNTKLIFIVIPRLYWLLPGLGVLAWLAGIPGLAAALVNLFLFLVAVKLGMAWHEVGHLLTASWMGGRPRRMVLGHGSEAFRREIRGVKVVLNSHFRGGVAFASFDASLKSLRLRYAVYVLGGILFNLGLAFLLFLPFGFDLDFLVGKYGLDLSSPLIGANLLLAAINIFPFKVNHQGLEIPSDGLNLTKIPFYSPEKLQSLMHAGDLLDAYDYYEQKEYDRALAVYDRCLTFFPDTLGIQISRSAALIKKRAYPEARAVLEKLRDEFDEETLPYYRSMVYNNLAAIHLMEGNLKEADICSERAFNLNKNNYHIATTRGAVLVEKGEEKTGIHLLKKFNNFSIPTNDTVTSAIYLAKGYRRLGKLKKSEQYAEFVRTHQLLLDEDERELMEKAGLGAT